MWVSSPLCLRVLTAIHAQRGVGLSAEPEAFVNGGKAVRFPLSPRPRARPRASRTCAMRAQQFGCLTCYVGAPIGDL
eukprot:1196421-Prymnesium_polylepis.2